MRSDVRLTMAAALVALAMLGAPVAAQPCSRADFESVVDQASATLRDMVQANTADFQRKLRTLREKRKWTQDQLMREGARFVRDDKITEFDERSAQLLAKINQGGDGGAKSADCKLLDELRRTMATLVEVQEAKWRHMSTAIDAELAK